MKSIHMKKALSLAALAMLPALVATASNQGLTASTKAAVKRVADADKFRADYDDFSKVEEAAADLNLRMAAEGSVLLKNENTLPMAKTAKVTVLGEQADCYVSGGAGSGAQSKPGYDETPDHATTIFEALTKEGIEFNTSVKTAYEAETAKPGSLAISGNAYEAGHYMTEVSSADSETVEFGGKYYKSLSSGEGTLGNASLTGYTDVALVVLSRTGAEGQDNEAYDLLGAGSKTENYMSLNKGERELLAYAKKNFRKVVLLVNSPSPMELADVEADDKIGGILWIGQTGWNGIEAMPKILTGEINPSGKTSDIYAAKAETNPTWYNFGDYRQSNYILNGVATDDAVKGKNSIDLGFDAADATKGFKRSGESVVDYTEGIYMGYRYYETVYAEIAKINQDKADAWYASAVTYPFGYGLSYTTFKQEIVSADKTSITSKDDVLKISVKVTNTGNVKGKDVVQLYNKAPYTDDETEKAEATLVAFDKTSELAPGASETIVLEVKAKDLASFDYDDLNADDHYGYELSEGDYVLSVRKNSHEVIDSRTITVASQIDWDGDNDENTPNAIFSQSEGEWAQFNTSSDFWAKGNNNDHYLHRTELVDEAGNVELEKAWTPGNPNALQKKLGWIIADNHKNNVFKGETHQYIASQEANDADAAHDYDDRMTPEVETDFQNPWVRTNDQIPSNWTQGAGSIGERGTYEITLPQMKGVDFNDAKWDTFMNQLTWDELAKVDQDGGYGSDAMVSIDKPAMKTHDGPGQIRKEATGATEGNGYAWVCEAVIGSTWNKELAHEQGVIEGNESILLGVTGWYAPGANMHRSPLSGRNFEYYSSDPVHSGWMLTNVIKGFQTKGGTVYMKHMFLNDQETSRAGIATFATEQSIREIYAKTFEIAIENADDKNIGIMTSFNRIGAQSSVSYAIQEQLYSTEWGFKGMSVTDAFNSGSGWDSEAMIRGNTIPLNSVFPIFPPATLIEGTWDVTLRAGKGGVKINDNGTAVESPTQYFYARNTAKSALYTYANSNGMSELNSNIMLSPKSLYLAPSKNMSGEAVYSSAELSSFKASMNSIFGDVGYEVSVSGLPEGVSLNLETGVMTGTAPEQVGCYQYTLTAKGKGKLSYITKSVTNAIYTLGDVELDKQVAVSPLVPTPLTKDNYKEYSSEDEAAHPLTTGFMTMFTHPAADYAGKIVRSNLTATGLPAGLTMDPLTGEITGTITDSSIKKGSKIKVDITQTYISADPAGFMPGYCFSEHVKKTTIYLNVLGEETPDNPSGDSSSSSSAPTSTSSSAAPAGGSSSSSEGKKGGCGGSVIAAASSVAALGLLASALVFKKKREEK